MNVATTWKLISDSNRTNDAVFLIDLQNRTFRYVNDCACLKLGYSRDELLQMGVLDIDPFMDEAAFQKITEQVQTQGFSLIETYHRTKDGRLFPVEVSGHLFEYNGEWVGISIARDITERKQKDNQLALFDYAFEHVDEAIFLINDDAQFVQVNEKACVSLGYTREELLTLQIFDIDPDFKPEHWEQYKVARLLGSPHKTIETRHKTKDGRIFSVEVRGTYFTQQGKNYNLSLVRDISERKATDRERRLLNYALNNVHESVWLIGHDAKIHYVNENVCHETGLAREELLTLTIPDVDPTFPSERWSEHWQDLKAKGAITLESNLKRKDGHIFPIEVNANYFEFDGESYNLAFVRDITERKATEQKITLLNHALDHVKEVVWLIDENAKFHYNNAAACRALGYTYEELLPLGVPDINPDYQLDVWPEHWQAFKANGSLLFESRNQTKDGRIFPVEINANYFEFDGKGYSLALVRDISERKATEKQLTLLNYALDHVGEAAWLIDENTKFHYNNAEACRAVGYTREEMLQLGVPDIDPLYQLEFWPEHWQDLKANGSLMFESLHKTKEGRIFPVEINANYFEFDGQGYNLALIRDITERKQAQEALQRSEALLAEAQRIAHVGSWEVDIVHNRLFWSDETFRIWEIDKSQFAATIEAFYETVHPEDLEKVTKAYNASIEHLTPYQVEHRLLFPDGRVKYVAERGEVFCDENGNRIRFVGTSMDITEQQHIKNTLEFIAQRGWKNSGESFLTTLTQYLAQIFGVDYVIIDKLGSSSTQAETVALYVKGDIVPNMLYDLKGTPCDGVMNGKLCTHPKNVQQLFPDDLLLVEMQVESYAGLPLWNTNGEVIGLIAVMDTKPMNDIAFITSILQLVATSVAAELERQRSEQVLLDAHHFLKQVVNTLADPVFVKDRQHRWILLNQAFCEFIGHPFEALIGKSDYDFFPKHEADIFWAKDESVFSNHSENINEEEFTDAAGIVRTILTKKTCYTDSNGQQFLVGIITDITERKKMEDTLAAREREFRTLAENTHNIIIRYDKEYRRIYVNPAYEQETGTLQTHSALNQTPDQVWIPINITPAEYKMILQHILETGEREEVLLEWLGSDGELRSHIFTMTPELDTDGHVVSVLAIGHDITDFKRSEARLKQRELEFRTLAENVPGILIRYDEKCRMRYINQNLRNGCNERDEWIGQTLIQIYPNDAIFAELHEIIKNVIETGQPIEIERFFPEHLGGTTWVFQYVAERDANDKIVGVLALGRDITERKKMEDELAIREEQFRVLAETLPSPVFRFDKECRRIYMNPMAEKISEIAAAELLYKKASDSSPLNKEELQKVEQAIQRVIDTREPQEEDVLFRVPSTGQIYYFHNNYAPEFDANGDVASVIVVSHDVTERRKMEDIIRLREQEFRVVVETSPAPIIRYDANCRRVYVNPAVEKISGKTASELLDHAPVEGTLLDKPVKNKIERILRYVLKTGRITAGEVELVFPDGKTHYFYNRYAPELDVNGKPVGVVLVGHDITAHKKAEKLLVQREREFRSLAENIPDCVTRYDAKCRTAYMNPALLSSIAPEALPVLGETLIQSHPDNPAAIELHQLLEQIIETGNAAEIEISVPNRGGELRTHLIRCVAEYDHNGKFIGVLAIGNDITERKQLEQQMFFHASYDSLTGLPNRRMLNNRIREEIAKAERNHYSIAVLFVDLDRFKEVNDTLGHEIGDCLLVEAAQRIRNCIRASDTVARLGGDEFVVILSSVGDVPPLERVTQSILVALAQPFYFGFEYSAYISASIGIAVYPQDANDAESLIGCADQAMYAAKESGRNNFSFFTASMQEQAQQRLRLIGCLREALDKNQFEVYYQPITCVVSGKPIKAEALVRWHHPELGMVSPALFIPIAEETDLIQDIGSWVFRQAADTAKRWNELSGDNENRLISVNMSPRQLTKGTGDQIAINYLQEIGLDSANIVVEITEGLLLDDSPEIIEKLERLRMAGIQISLDDFGTGYSAMAYLKKFNLDYLKIDQSFVRGMETDLGDHAITEAIIMMAHRLGLKVIAEGVETEGQRKLLAEAGCEYIQGYFYSKPLPIDAFLSYVLK